MHIIGRNFKWKNWKKLKSLLKQINVKRAFSLKLEESIFPNYEAYKNGAVNDAVLIDEPCEKFKENNRELRGG